MKPRAIFNLLCLLMVTGICAQKATLPELTLRQIFDEEFIKASAVAKNLQIPVGQIQYSDTLQSHLTGQDIIINLPQIEKSVKGKSELFKRVFVRFVLGHELGHQQQGRILTKSAIDYATGEFKIYLECHADIIAGMIMTQVSSNDILSMSQANPSINYDEYNNSTIGVMNEVLGQILKMDNVNLPSASHPSNTERLIAFRTGRIAANIFTTQFVLEEVDAQAKQTREFKDKVEMYSDFSKAIGFDPQSDDIKKANIFRWAQYEAMRILNANNNYTTNLILYNRKIDWHKKAEYPYVDFSFEVYNDNPVEVIFDGRVFTELKSRNDPKNIILALPVSGYEFTKNIPAKQSATIKGKVKWVADDNYMPHLVFPGDERAIYTCFDQSNRYFLDNQSIEKFSVDFSKWNSESENELMDLLYFVNDNAVHKILKKGIGVNNASGLTPVAQSHVKDDPIDYRPAFILNTPEFFSVSQNNEGLSVSADVETQSKEQSEANFKKMNDLIRAAFPQLKPWSSKKYLRTTYSKGGTDIITVDLINLGDDRYKIVLEIFQN